MPSACVKQIQRLGFKPRTQLNIFCPGCGRSIKVFSDKPDEAEIHKFLANHTGHDCFFGFNDGRKWRIQNDGGIESERPQRIEPKLDTEKNEVSPSPIPFKQDIQIETPGTESISLPEGASPQAEDELIEEYPFDEGWIKLHRKIIENPIFKDSEALQLFIYFLLRANHKANRFPFNQKEIVVERGQLITGINQICKDTGLSTRKIRTRLELLKNIGILTRKTTNRFSIITICNYDYYQNSKNGERQAKRQAKNLLDSANQIVLGGQSSDKQATTNKNDKNIKIYVEGSDELRLAILLLEEIKKNKPDFKQPTLQSWAKEVDLMIRRDGRKPERIQQVIKWCQGDPFWCKNILSTSSLRNKFDRLEMEMGSSQKEKGPERPKEKPRILTAED